MAHSGTYRPYRPSNGSEGDEFMANWCYKCMWGNFEDIDRACEINLRAMTHQLNDPEYPAEWNFTNGGVPQCSAFTADGEAEFRCDQTADLFGNEGQSDG